MTEFQCEEIFSDYGRESLSDLTKFLCLLWMPGINVLVGLGAEQAGDLGGVLEIGVKLLNRAQP
ncbi:hypothetical protein DYH09_27545 [bacterium CPR1]|nr:hypothetical protein [bacterium CPR1]